MKRTLTVMLIFAGIIWFTGCTDKPMVEISDKEHGIKGAIEFQNLRTKDPALGYVPIEELLVAMEETQRLQEEFAVSSNRTEFAAARWRERGPNNVGGRTRSILIDKNDSTRNTIWVGSVSGGLWKSEHISSSNPQWEKVSDFLANLNIGSIAQDPSNPQLIYVGTGEATSNGVNFPGIGVFRTTDGGDTWAPMAASSSFRVTRSLFVHPTTGDVYAATLTKGLQRSQDQGQTWEKVAGYITPGIDFASNNVYDIEYAAGSEYIYISTINSVRRSLTGNPGEWETINGTGFPSGTQRVELAVSNSTPEVLYALTYDGDIQTSFYASSNGGDSWQERTPPPLNDLTRTQAWYDLEIAVSPFNPDYLIAGEIITQRSNNGGLSWNYVGGGIHPDHHKFVFDEENEGRVYFGNDGGVFRSTNNGGSVAVKNKGYITTQFYGCAIHPEAEKDYFLAGAQDNGSWAVAGAGAVAGKRAYGNDGVLCHIDQDDPNIQIVSWQSGNWILSTDGGQNFSGGLSANGSFVSPGDYDSEANIMYVHTFNGDFYRWNVTTNASEVANISGFNMNISIIYADPTVSNRVYFGSYNGGLVRIDNAHDDGLAEVSSVGGFSGNVSSIDTEIGNPDHLLVTISSYGVQSIFESEDGGESWVGVEGNLPNMPVYWAIFNPKDATQALIGTELGVWVTELLDQNNTVWIPPANEIGTPLTRVTQLQVRQSDYIVLASTYGRGLFTTDVFAEPKAKMRVEKIGYIDAALKFNGDIAINADSWLWNFGDGGSSSVENTTHAFDAIGEYPVSLTINDELTTEDVVKILPNRSTPYQPSVGNYSGDFESHPEDYGVHTISGSSFSRGNSTMPGKDGVHSGDNAFVLGIDEEFYQKGTHSMLYIPNFNMEEAGIYEFSFWTRFRLNNGVDGFRVEYSTNRGEKWSQLGSNSDNGWYNFKNNNLETAGFPQGASYFSGVKNGYVQYKLDISELSGQKDVAFRFVFKAGISGNYRGVAIDDVEITKYEGELVTDLRSFSGEFTDPNEITISWLTQPEYNCVEFELERSINGFDFEKIETIASKGGTSADMYTYKNISLGQRKLYFFRLKVINTDEPNEYSYEFYSDIIVVRKNLEGIEVQYVFPNPIQENIFITFTDVSENLNAQYELFSIDGKLVTKGIIPVAGTGTIPVPASLTAGVYLLSIQIDEGEEKVFKLLKN